MLLHKKKGDSKRKLPRKHCWWRRASQKTESKKAAVDVSPKKAEDKKAVAVSLTSVEAVIAAVTDEAVAAAVGATSLSEIMKLQRKKKVSTRGCICLSSEVQ